MLTHTDASGRRTGEVTNAVARLDPEEFVALRKIEFLASQRTHPFAKQLRLVEQVAQSRHGRETLFGYLWEDGAPPRCSGIGAVADTSRSPAKANTPLGAFKTLKEMTPASLNSDEDDEVDFLPPVQPRITTIQSPFGRTNSAPSGPSREAAATAAESRLTTLKRSATALPSTFSPSKRPAPRLSSHVPNRNPFAPAPDLPQVSSTASTFTPSEAITFPAGSYDVVLIVDTREVESKANRDKIEEALAAKGVNVETRALRLGDMLWVARRRDGMGGEEDECVLDWVVERKRLDDLCTSIRDGRYNEQCVSASLAINRASILCRVA